ncbi:SHOCT domain-containing protein [Kribbella qitaiheensis]|uniref:SHOCT domain-containing protein n=1 Tax=Kribbella qitaiheensis TaxID=1544730 RepID=UPI0036064CF2
MMNGGQDALLIVLVLSIWSLAVAAAVALGVHLIRSRRPAARPMPSPLGILERRYAMGEIDREQFDDARARLREHELDL